LNYPNPFETSTQLLFRLSNRASIELEIYTVSGKRVRTIEDVRDGGEVWVEWDGRDAAGGDLANGTYLYVATVDFEGIERAPVVLRGKMSKIR
jgi:flagellar hook assembly protein FlgD